MSPLRPGYIPAGQDQNLGIWAKEDQLLKRLRESCESAKSVESRQVQVQEVGVHEVKVGKRQSTRNVNTDCRAGIMGSLPGIIKLMGGAGPGPMGVSHRPQMRAGVRCSCPWQLLRCPHSLTYLRLGITV